MCPSHSFLFRLRLPILLICGALGATGPLLALNPELAADQYAIQGWYTEDGLPSSRVRAVVQTRDGYLWLATAQGIARFDGARFTVYKPSNRPDLLTHNFYQVAEGRDGTLWFASNNGLFSYKDDRFRRYHLEDGLAGHHVRTVLVAQDGSVLAGTINGVSIVRDGRVLPQEGVWKQTQGTIRAMMQKADGSFLVGSAGGLWHVRGERIEKLSGTPTYPNGTYTAMLEEPDGSLWVGSNRDLRHVHPDGRVEVYAENEGLTSRSVESLRRDRDGGLWIGTVGGLFRIRDGRLQQATYRDHIGSGFIGEMWESREGSLWVGSNSGLFQIRETPARAISFAQGLEQAVVLPMIDTRDGAWWIGLWSGGVYRYENGHATPVPEFASVRSTVFYAFLEDDDGVLWIGGDSGLYRYEDGAFTNLSLGAAAESWRTRLAAEPDLELPGLAHPRVNSIASDGAGGHWIGTLGGLYHRSRDNRFRIVPSTLTKNIRAVWRARNGDIWATIHEHGVLRGQNGAWREYHVADGLASEYVRAIYEDKGGSIWIASMEGLHRFQNERWHVYTAAQGLPEQAVVSVVEDNFGFLWLGSAQGIMRVERAAFDALDAGKIGRVTGQLLTRRDGMPDSECSEQGSPNAWATRTGALLFPTNSGVAVVDPRTARFNPLPPPVHIERVEIGGKPAAFQGSLSVPPGSRDLEIYFTATSVLAPDKVRFRTRLSPLDADWVSLGATREVRYPRLPPGAYRFQVIACNNDGVWNEEGASLAFTVRPFFYQTTWFIVLMIGAGVGAMAGFFSWRVKQVRQRERLLQVQNQELERRVAERTGALAERSSELAKSNDTLRASEYFYHSLVESLPQIILRKDANGVYTYANSAFGEMHDRSLDQIIGKSDREIYPPEQAERFRADDLSTMETRKSKEYESVIEKNGKKRYLHVRKVPLYNARHEPIGVQVLFWDMTTYRETEEQLRQTQKELIEASRLAGMAEIATGVLHNIGNVLNSVNTSAGLVAAQVRRLRTASIGKVAQLLNEQGERLGEFFTSDPRAKKLPGFLTQLTEQFESERATMLEEVTHLQTNVDHIKEIVAAQQSYATRSGVLDTMPPAELFEAAVGLSEVSLNRHGINVVREFAAVPLILVQRQKALQVLVNLLRNAKDSILAAKKPTNQLTLSTRLVEGDLVELRVTDSGVGIAPENLTRIFAFGFTTKTTGHGFGLHSSALAAKEMGGSLTAYSEGPGHGATFVFCLPVAKSESRSPLPVLREEATAGAVKG